jgi:hypothetical protein
MASKEIWGDAPDIVLNGEVVRGRSKQNEDGSFRALDLVELHRKTKLHVETASGEAHDFVKAKERDEDGIEVGAMDGWVRKDAEVKLGGDVAGRFVLLEPNPKGTSFLTHGVVMKHGLELGFIPSEEPSTHVIQSLGVVARMSFQRSREERLKRKVLSWKGGLQRQFAILMARQ